MIVLKIISKLKFLFFLISVIVHLLIMIIAVKFYKNKYEIDLLLMSMFISGYILGYLVFIVTKYILRREMSGIWYFNKSYQMAYIAIVLWIILLIFNVVTLFKYYDSLPLLFILPGFVFGTSLLVK